MLKSTKVEAALSVNDGRVVLIVKRSDDNNVLRQLRWDLQEIEREGFHALSQRVGGTVVKMLQDANPDEFARYPLLAPPPRSAAEQQREVAMRLIRFTREQKTAAYVEAIDALIDSGGSEIDRYDLVEIWKGIRQEVIDNRW
jgi:hypothetical protein